MEEVKKTTRKKKTDTEAKVNDGAEKKTRTRKTNEEKEFSSIKEETEYLKKKRKLSDEEKERLAFLTKPVTVITDWKSMKKPTKHPVKKKAKPVVKYENGEYIPAPTTYTKLKSYVTAYCRAMGWKSKKFRFNDNKYLGFQDFKIEGDKEKKEVYVKGSIVFQSPTQMWSKAFSRTFTIENHKQVREMIIQTYLQARKWKGIEEPNEKELINKGWCRIY